ncbi:hypothetical protein DV517_20280 [Streptomyces sp. S816]|nr:hypothetical protein DV517_20280 [Streptomyces sp. S816]
MEGYERLDRALTEAYGAGPGFEKRMAALAHAYLGFAVEHPELLEWPPSSPAPHWTRTKPWPVWTRTYICCSTASSPAEPRPLEQTRLPITHLTCPDGHLPAIVPSLISKPGTAFR